MTKIESTYMQELFGKRKRILHLSVAAMVASMSVGADAADSEVEELRKQLNAQQSLLEQLQKKLEQQQELTERLMRKEGSLEEEIIRDEAIAKGMFERRARAADRDVRETVRLGKDEKVQILFSGQVNRMATVVDDGDSTDTYFVDNDASNTRIRFIGTAKANDDLTLGTRIELAIAPDESSKVNQLEESTGDYFDQRWADIYLRSQKYGTIYLGKGDTASNNAAEVDLSKTDVVQYSSIADIGGGMFFRDDDDNLTDIKVSSAFQNEDGLGRQSRLRYDTPTWNGFYASTSAVSDERFDGSLWWSGKVGGFSAAGAFAVADRNEDNEDLRYDTSFSFMHQDTGLNLTLAAALTERDGGDDQENFYVKLGWLTNIFGVGPTAFGVDYTDSQNTPTTLEDGDSVSIAVVQQFQEFGTELYAIFRNFALDSDGPTDYQDINMGSVGARVKF